MIINAGTIEIDRPSGREINPDVWVMPRGEMRMVDRPAVGWRMDVVYYDESGIRAVGLYRPENTEGSPFPDGWASCAPQAECQTGLNGNIRASSFILGLHSHPHPDCGCGLRLMEHVGQVSKYVREKGDQFLREWSQTSEPVQMALCISSVVGLGKTCAGEELDPEGTIRTEWLALDSYLIFGQKDAHVAAMVSHTGMTAIVVPDLGGIS
jgi:hypothetical protein